MFNQYFGYFLINTGIITHAQLLDAIQFQQSTNLKLGVIAVNEGFMRAEQVEEVHVAQKRIDKRFGDLAVEMGFLTAAQVEHLLKAQKQGHLLLGQALVEKQYITMEQLEKALDEYKTEHKFSQEQFKALQENNIDDIIKNFVNLGDKSQIYSEYISLMLRNIIRFIDPHPRVEILRGEVNTKWLFTQKIYGEFNLSTGIAADDPAVIEIASKYAQEDISAVDELATDSIGEFLNLNNGIFLVNMSNKGIDLEMQPQAILENQLISLQQGVGVTIYLPNANFSLVISNEDI